MAYSSLNTGIMSIFAAIISLILLQLDLSYECSLNFARRSKYLQMSAIDDGILRRVDKWACIKDCGACCKLGPLEDRPDLSEYLTELN